MRVIVGLVLCGLLWFCGSAQKLEQPLTEGEKLQRSKCISCHRLQSKEKHNPEEWKDILEQHKNRIQLDKQEWEILSKYFGSP